MRSRNTIRRRTAGSASSSSSEASSPPRSWNPSSISSAACRVEMSGRRVRAAIWLALALIWSAQASSQPRPAPAQEELPLSGPPYRLAEEAYDAMERRDYRTAIAKVEEAIRQRPDVLRL